MFLAPLLCAASASPAPNIHTILDAALVTDISLLERALSTAEGRAEIVKTTGGTSVLHALFMGMHTSVAGEISRLVGWSDTRRTLYRHEFKDALAQAMKVSAPRPQHAPHSHASLTRTPTVRRACDRSRSSRPCSSSSPRSPTRSTARASCRCTVQC